MQLILCSNSIVRVAAEAPTKYNTNTFSTFQCILKYRVSATTSMRWDDLSQLADRVRPRTSTPMQPPQPIQPYTFHLRYHFRLTRQLDNPVTESVRKMILYRKSKKKTRGCFISLSRGEANMAASRERIIFGYTL